MSGWDAAALLLGGIGLFLVGMEMMTEGLKLSAGPALERILRGATRTRWHALGSGALVTALVQSSSAVTVAAIGFVNAGLLTLAPAMWVLFGANVGTTMTGWIVALLGLKLKMEALALPLVAGGVALRLGGKGRRAALGTALAGFGLLFLGIGTLQQSFAGLAPLLQPPSGAGWLALLAQVAAGALLTVLMQSSSASIVIALTAAQQGLLTPLGAAAVVIGANIGTTATALLATIGATANARRAAMAHLAFNGLAACVALALLPVLLPALEAGARALGASADLPTLLAAFHTSFNLLGVVLMWPLADALARWLGRRFVPREDDEARPHYLDDTVLQVPALAVDALARETGRVGALARRLVRKALAGEAAQALEADATALAELTRTAEDFAQRMQRGSMLAATSARLARVLRTLRYHETVGEMAQLAATLPEDARWIAPQPLQDFEQAMVALLSACEDAEPAPRDPQSHAALQALQERMEQCYEALKSALLAAGAQGAVPLASMEAALRKASALRRGAQQAVKAHSRAAEASHGPGPGA